MVRIRSTSMSNINEWIMKPRNHDHLKRKKNKKREDWIPDWSKCNEWNQEILYVVNFFPANSGYILFVRDLCS